MIFRPAVALAASLLATGTTGATTLRKDEAGSKDVFVYAFEIPGTLGVPGVPADLNFDAPNVPATALAPFGATLGVAESTPFVNPQDPDFPITVREHTTRSLVQFNLSGLGIASDRVASATFSLSGIGALPPFAAPSEAFPIIVDLKPVLADWDEGSVTWNTRPEVGDVLTSVQMTSGTQVLEFDLTDPVMGWLTDPSSNYGFELSQRAVVQADMPSPFTPNDLFATGLFASSANPEEVLRPTLQVSEVPVPVPASGLLLLGAAGLLAGIRRSRRG